MKRIDAEEISYPWGHNRPYNDYGSYIRKLFGTRIQKLSIDAGFTCPNRDGSKGRGGCTYCNNKTFRPDYVKPDSSITTQLNEGISFFADKYPEMKYLAYFQSYTNTYAPVEILKRIYEEAIRHPKVVGLVIGTRPDCVNDEILDYISDLAIDYYVTIEYGIESTLNRTLEVIQRYHDFETSVRAIRATHERGIHTGGHLMIGLPGESAIDMLTHADHLSQLPLDTLKLHQLQIVRHTVMASQYRRDPGFFNLYELEDYIEFVVDFLERLNPAIHLERFTSESPFNMLVSPSWGLKNFEVVDKVVKRLISRNTYQGRLFKK